MLNTSYIYNFPAGLNTIGEPMHQTPLCTKYEVIAKPHRSISRNLTLHSYKNLFPQLKHKHIELNTKTTEEKKGTNAASVGKPFPPNLKSRAVSILLCLWLSWALRSCKITPFLRPPNLCFTLNTKFLPFTSTTKPTKIINKIKHPFLKFAIFFSISVKLCKINRTPHLKFHFLYVYIHSCYTYRCDVYVFVSWIIFSFFWKVEKEEKKLGFFWVPYFYSCRKNFNNKKRELYEWFLDYCS